jgi:Erv1 / Alr family
MPCNCKIPYKTYPEAKEWGPVLWTLLHGIAERVGTCPFPQYQADERRALASLFVKVGQMIPCPSCKEHYEVFLKENPVVAYPDLKPFVRDWFWRLHNMVNESKGITSPPLDTLPALYGNANLRMAIAQLRDPMRRAIQIAGKMFLAYNEFNTVYQSLLSIYGI